MKKISEENSKTNLKPILWRHYYTLYKAV